jgi:hypothetical protein
MSGISSDKVQIAGQAMFAMPSQIARYSIPVSSGSRFDLIITLCGSNWSLGTTDKRFLKVAISRRYSGSYSVTEVFGTGARFYGSTANFGTSGVGVCVETSNSSSFIFQIHNTYSNGPTAGFSCHIEAYGAGQPTQLSTYTGANYTTNPF